MAKKWKTAKWMRKAWHIYIYIYMYIYIYIYTHTHNCVFFTNGKESSQAICDNMDGTGGHQVKQEVDR
jgi:hypothetical protein